MYFILIIVLLSYVSISRSQLETTTDHHQIALTTEIPSDVPFIEQELVGPFKVWHVAGFVGSGIATILIAICCMIDLRVPRTKEEIEANYEKRQAAHLYVDKLGKMEFTGLRLKSQALMQKERELKKQEFAETKAKKKEEGPGKKAGQSKQGIQSHQTNMAGFNPQMMTGGMPGGMGGMPFHPAMGMMMGNPAMFGGMNMSAVPGGVGPAAGMAGMMPGMMMMGPQPGMMAQNGQQVPGAGQTGIDAQPKSKAASRWGSLIGNLRDPAKREIAAQEEEEDKEKTTTEKEKITTDEKKDGEGSKSPKQEAPKPTGAKKKWSKK